MKHRKPILWALAIAELLLLAYSAAAFSRFVDVQELGFAGVVSIDSPMDIPVWRLVSALAIGIAIIVVFTASENSN